MIPSINWSTGLPSTGNNANNCNMFFDDADFDPQSDLVDLRGKVAVVTGDDANTHHTTLHLARAGAKVYLGTPHSSEPLKLLENLRWELGYGYGEIVWFELDLSCPARTRDAARWLLDMEGRKGRLDILVNGCCHLEGKGKGKEEINELGLSRTVTVNYISPFVFTKTLLPLLAKTANEGLNEDVRIVNVIPASHKIIPKVNLKFKTVDDLNVRGLPSGFLRFCHSKFLCLLWTRHLQHLINAEGIHNMIALAVDPGAPSSSPSSHAHDNDKHHIHILRKMLSIHIHMPTTTPIEPHEQGYATAFAAAGEAVWGEWERYKGGYVEGVKRPKVLSIGGSEGEHVEERLWELTEKVLRVCRV
ncbi:hypothetical protein VNI00_008687 [Paramarasmius palmivorus]|uniref:NAD(P)-binding protein n=1 Tax=Paramarasmius palmivorus TaxID=297713 RepID=A0AAW0CWN1_9AGAR